ncbi:hydantoinase B/oxoprolinase family protein [Acinetobacter sichuanensis]|uniref:Hydantoinase B/oxoprolinase family protein n=1 Tax=Acinetobacter sichuanensis TaxID=2136183 RepID=A0A371YQZ1_9GAMM|nr:hydantoinase B/oxoprolinase family protein [Acinetobacter sichuanensis]RFC83873.1 hydantoinase B/oxoprolinase family protein [Acinetobacter sichuanensis]
MTTNLIDIQMQVMWNRLVSVVEEQALTLIRTAFSTSVREAGDLSAGVFDREGRMIAQAVTGTPGHVNTMAEAVVHFINDIGADNIYEGDVYVTNDPWKGTGHLHDITIVSPSFYKGKLIGYFASTAHVVDIGGRGFGPDAREVYEEGLFIPVMKLFERGKVNKDLVNLIRHNVRENDRVIGDFYALSACNETGHLRLIDMLREFNLNDLDMIGGFILEHSRKATLDCFKSLPHGQYTNSMTLDGYDIPVTLSVTLTVGPDGILTDFIGTSGMSQFGINVPLGYAKAYACYALKCILAPEIPNNTASLEPFEVVAPEGCILNAKHPAPVSVRHVLGHFVPDLVLGALHKCLPGSVPAEGASALWNLHMSVRPLATNPNGRNSEMLMFNSGGMGARANLDGLSATAFPSGVHTMPVEATEHAGPVIVWRKEFRNGSGGAGTLRGGLGQEIEISASEGYEFRFSAMFDRINYPARGREGGLDGTKGFVGLDDGTVLRGKGQQQVPSNRRLVLSLPGGGGYGDPRKRPWESVERDVRFGYISPEQAEADYGYIPVGSEK